MLMTWFAQKRFFFTSILNTQTSVYRKKHQLGLFTNFLSLTPFIYKIGLIKRVVYCVFELSSSWKFFHQDIFKIKHLLVKYEYQPWMADSWKKAFAGWKIWKKNKHQSSSKQPTSYFQLPYLRVPLSPAVPRKHLLKFASFILKRCRSACF